MHESYEDDDDGYDDDQYNHDYSSDPYKWYFKFDVGPNTPISDWLGDMINKWIGPSAFEAFKGINEYNGIVNIPGFPSKKFPVNSYIPDTGKDNSFQYLGNNYMKEPIWKTKYFVVDHIQQQYVSHIQSHAKHFISQPRFYNGLFDILN